MTGLVPPKDRLPARRQGPRVPARGPTAPGRRLFARGPEMLKLHGFLDGSVRSKTGPIARLTEPGREQLANRGELY